jgi:diguanylate cyclase (GGDEF)-like protein
MPDTMPFEGYHVFVKEALEGDNVSFNRITRLFIEEPSGGSTPFSFLIQKLSGKVFREPAALSHWKQILSNKKDMESKLGRRVDVMTATMDYFDQHDNISPESSLAQKGRTVPEREDWINRIYTPSYHAEKLKEEVLRAKRYNHALSAILLDIDDFSRINEQCSFSVGDEILVLIVKIIQKSIRTVDIISRYSGDIFLIILPNTNKREAGELAERIRINISKRTKRMSQLSDGVTATMSVGQCEKDETAAEFTKKIESVLETGKQKQRNAVYIQ